MKEKRTHGQTHISISYPWGVHPRNGHRLLCRDGKIRAAELAPTADTFFSIPARVRVRGKWISGYATTDTVDGSSVLHGQAVAYVFRHHTCHDDKVESLPDVEFRAILAQVGAA